MNEKARIGLQRAREMKAKGREIQAEFDEETKDEKAIMVKRLQEESNRFRKYFNRHMAKENTIRNGYKRRTSKPRKIKQKKEKELLKKYKRMKESGWVLSWEDVEKEA